MASSRRKTCSAVFSSLNTKTFGLECREAGTGLSSSAKERRRAVKSDRSDVQGVLGPKNSPGSLSGSPYSSSADEICRSSLNALRMPSNTTGNISIQFLSAWRVMDALSCLWKRSTRQLCVGAGIFRQNIFCIAGQRSWSN